MRPTTVVRVGARYLGVTAALTFFLFPIFWIVTIALKPPDEWTTVPLTWLPRTITLENFREILFGGGASDVTGQVSSAVPAIVNSLIAAPLGTVIAMFVGTSAAFAISRFGTGGRVLPFQILTLRMFPPIVILVPVFIMWVNIHLYDTQVGLALLYGLFGAPFAVWLMRSFFDSVPRETFDAAVVDGCSMLGAFVRTVLPLVRAGFVVTALFVFILAWSDFGVAFLLTSRAAVTIPVQLQLYVSGLSGTLYGPRAALGLLAIVPPVVIGVAIQRYLVTGLTFGAVKA
jgi:multiple sugar transport system permease protein